MSNIEPRSRGSQQKSLILFFTRIKKWLDNKILELMENNMEVTEEVKMSLQLIKVKESNMRLLGKLLLGKSNGI